MNVLNSYLGTYFPNVASIFMPPLAGTRLFPFSANQEKLHFSVAVNGKIGHFDGDQDPNYFEDIRRHMGMVFRSWDQLPTSTDYLQMDSRNLSYEFNRKFPFAKQRFHQKCWARKEKHTQVQRGQVKIWNSPAKPQPHSSQVGTLVVSENRRQHRADPQRSQEELDRAKVSFILIKFKKYFGRIQQIINNLFSFKLMVFEQVNLSRIP